jgi:hypothetical protein
MKLLLAKCVWGAAYVDTMLRVNLPSLLAAGNLPAVAAGHDVEHAIFTTAADAAVIAAHPVYRAVQAAVPCRIEILPEAAEDGSYLGNIARMNAAHRRILAECSATGAAWLFDQPDHVWGERALSHLAAQAQAGVRCVMFAGIRTVRETMLPALAAWTDGPVLTVPHRALIGLATENLHIHDMVRFWGAPVSTFWPHHVSWRVGPRSFLRRAFHVQPFLMAAPPAGVMPARSVDDDFADHAYPDPAQVAFIGDTDDFAVIEVSPRLHVMDWKPGRLSVPQLAAWAGEQLNPRRRAYFSHPIRFRGDGTAERRWQRIADFSAAIATTVDRFAVCRALQAAAAAERPELAALLGRLARDPAAHRHLPWPPPQAGAPDAAITEYLARLRLCPHTVPDIPFPDAPFAATTFPDAP